MSSYSNRFGTSQDENRSQINQIPKPSSVSSFSSRPALGNISNNRPLIDRTQVNNEKKSSTLFSSRPIASTSSVFGSSSLDKDATTENFSSLNLRNKPRTYSMNQALPSARYSSTSSSVSNSTKMSSPRVDQKNIGFPLEVPEYADEIYRYYSDIESKKLPDPTYMDRQPEINSKMRSILVDWLVEVHYKFKLRPETLFLTASIADRFLTEKQVSKNKLQLVGVTAMLLAAKYEEIYAPEVRDFIYISAKTYTRDEILKMERLMLQTLKFALTQPTVYQFMPRLHMVGDSTEDERRLANYVAELAMLEYQTLEFKPSVVAASCVYIARRITRRDVVWTSDLEYYSGCSEGDLFRCLEILSNAVASAPTSKLQSVYKKYSSSKQNNVASLAK